MPEEVFEEFEVIDGAFAQKDSKTVTLPEVLSEDSEVWVNWLYPGVDSFNRHHEQAERLRNLGDMLECPKFQDLALNFFAR